MASSGIIGQAAAPARGLQRVLLHKMRRKTGNATWLYDWLNLRKPVMLCLACEWKMPWRWTRKFEYEKVEAFHAFDAPCDYCRTVTSVSFFLPGEGAVWQEREYADRSVAQVEARERALYMKDPRHFLGV